MASDIQIDDMQSIDMRRRIRELQSIPERDRSDAEWDELNELEIRTAPGNRDYDRTQERQGDRRQGLLGGQGRRSERNIKLQGNKNGNPLRQKSDGQPEGRLLKRQNRRPKRPMDIQAGVVGGPNAAPTTPIIVDLSSGGDKSDR
ncbi:MAG: hypothetical protein LBR88_00175 [Zoogloeaceae bacterium]|nr:hypothetical protein [Zoogloeaceae bacterium]